MNTIPITFEQDFARIDFTTSVTSESIYSLCDSVEQAIGYYQYPTVEIRIHSPGGESNALRHYADQLARWTKKSLNIRTVALTECASAAALLLSLGTLGHRRASLSSRLLYHRPRVEAGPALSREMKKFDGVLTSESGAAVIRRLEQLEAMIKREDGHHHGLVQQHIAPNGDADSWFSRERQRRASILETRRSELESAANRGAIPIDARDSKRLTDATTALADHALSDMDSFEVLQAIFSLVLDADSPSSPALFWALMLIDHVDGLDLGTPAIGGVK